jgi:hypothetical protein
MSTKATFANAKTRLVQLMEEKPLETLAVISATALATAKLISSITEARNSSTWKREVRRRERNQKI